MLSTYPERQVFQRLSFSEAEKNDLSEDVIFARDNDKGMGDLDTEDVR